MNQTLAVFMICHLGYQKSSERSSTLLDLQPIGCALEAAMPLLGSIGLGIDHRAEHVEDAEGHRQANCDRYCPASRSLSALVPGLLAPGKVQPIAAHASPFRSAGEFAS